MDNVYKINEFSGLGGSHAGLGGGFLGFLLGILFGGRGFGGFGGFGGYGSAPVAGTMGVVNYAEANQNQILNRLDFNTLVGKLDVANASQLAKLDVMNATNTAGFANINSALCNGFHGVENAICGLQSTVLQSTNQIIMNQNQNTQVITSLITNNEISAKNAQIASLEAQLNASKIVADLTSKMNVQTGLVVDRCHNNNKS